MPGTPEVGRSVLERAPTHSSICYTICYTVCFQAMGDEGKPAASLGFAKSPTCTGWQIATWMQARQDLDEDFSQSISIPRESGQVVQQHGLFEHNNGLFEQRRQVP